MPAQFSQSETDWNAIYQHLQAGRYEVAAQLLLKLQVASFEMGDSTSATAAAAARQICLALVSYRAEIEWHQLAQGNAELRQRALSQNVLSLLALVQADILNLTDSEVDGLMGQAEQRQPTVPQELDHVNLWQRIQQLIERQRPLDHPASETPTSEGQSSPQAASHQPPAYPTLTHEEAAEATEMAQGRASIPAPDETEPLASSTLEVQEGAELPPTAPQDRPDQQQPSGEVEAHEAADSHNLAPDEPESTGEIVGAPTDRAADAVPGFPQTEEEPPDLAIYCLGVFRIYQHGRPIEQWNGLKGLSILKYLAAHRGTPVSKDVLMDVFWPEADLEAARRNLHQAIYSLRQTLRRQVPDVQHIRFENNQYLLNPRLTIWVDVDEFEKRVRQGRTFEFAGRLNEALAEYGIADSLYRGAFLEEDVYEDWPNARREYLHNTYLEIADRISENYLQQGAYAAAIGLCQKVLRQDPCYENAHRRLMRCYHAQGQRNLAIRQYQMCVQTLRTDLDVPPSEETENLFQEIMGAQ